MTQVRRARNYLVYLVAAAISGLFSFIGRPAPSWAQETTSQHNATVFQQLMQTAQGTVQNRLQRPAPTAVDNRDIKLQGTSSGAREVFPEPPGSTREVFPEPPGSTREVFPEPPASQVKAFINKAFMIDKDVNVTWIGAQQERFNFMVNTIKDKIERGENLNDIELLYFNVLLNNYVEEKVRVDRYTAN